MALDFVAWHDRTAADHQQQADKHAAAGYRYLSFAIYGDRTNPRFAAVLVKRPVVVAQQAFHGQSAADFQQTFNQMSAKGFGPVILSATGPVDNPLIASVFEPMTPTPLTRHGITKDQLVQMNVQAYKDGLILRWADAYGTPDQPRYVAVWHPNPARTEWNCGSLDDPMQNAMNDPASDLQRRFNALTSSGPRMAFLAHTPSMGLINLYTDDEIGPWEARSGMTSAQYQAKFNELVPKGLVPIRVSAQGSGNDARFAVLFAGQEQPNPRSFRMQGPSAVAAIDQVMEQYLKTNRLFGASLAIVQGTRLVYAKGYTWAGPNHPNATPTTLYRQASVSKNLASLALYRFMQQNPSITLNTTMQSILNLTTPSGGAPADSRFGQITLRHLLESTSGLDNGIIWQDIAAQQAFKTTLPVTPLQLARWGTTLSLTNNPGDPNQVKYGNAAYFYLSQVVARLYQTDNQGANSFEAALQKAFAPLQVSRIRGSRSLIGEQLPDEIRYHMDQLPISPSLRSTDRPWVATQYGGWSTENHDGSGGISAAVVDLARIAAMYSVRQGNPLLTTASLDALFTNAANATKNLTGPDAHGYHGWDWATVNDAAKHQYSASKGGWMPSYQSAIIVNTGGLSYVIATNTNERAGSVNWFDGVSKAAAAQNWGTTDLFPQFGMASFPAQAVQTPSTAPGVPVKPVENIKQVQHSMQKQSVMSATDQVPA